MGARNGLRSTPLPSMHKEHGCGSSGVGKRLTQGPATYIIAFSFVKRSTCSTVEVLAWSCNAFEDKAL